MAIYTRNMPQVAVYWEPGPNSGFGACDFTLVDPVVINCRWQDKAELVRDAQHREFTSTAVVYPDRELAPGGYVALTTLDDDGQPDSGTPERAREVRAAGASPSLRNAFSLQKTWLGAGGRADLFNELQPANAILWRGRPLAWRGKVLTWGG